MYRYLMKHRAFQAISALRSRAARLQSYLQDGIISLHSDEYTGLILQALERQTKNKDGCQFATI